MRKQKEKSDDELNRFFGKKIKKIKGGKLAFLIAKNIR